jgi:hypothetical protein
LWLKAIPELLRGWAAERPRAGLPLRRLTFAPRVGRGHRRTRRRAPHLDTFTKAAELAAARDGRPYLFPPSYLQEAERLVKTRGYIPCGVRLRVAADAISSPSDHQALRLYYRLTGSSQGSVLDPIVS